MNTTGLRDDEALMYARRGRTAHVATIGEIGVGILCNELGEIVFGTATQAEREHAVRMPLCKRCAHIVATR
jgi:hypothetical protein